ncbi:MAG: polyprenyl synthetase family protein [Candidatus Eisenbacteria bacterium]
MATPSRARTTAWPEPFEADRRRVDARLAARLTRLPGVPPRLARALRHAALTPGKRLRPLLVLLGYDAVGGTAAKRRHSLTAAVAVEFVHAFSLVHDDLPALDDDALRRGRPTLHKAFDEATAILAGDALLALAFEDLAALGERGGSFSPLRVTRAMRELARASGASGMVAGQVLDLAAEGRWGKALRRAGHTLPGVRAIQRQKTGALVAASLVVGGHLGGGSTRQVTALRAIGHDLGQAFQIADDLLNEHGDARALGKNAGTDRERGKATWHAAAGLPAAQRALARLHARALRGAELFSHHRERFARLAAFLAVRRA